MLESNETMLFLACLLGTIEAKVTAEATMADMIAQNLIAAEYMGI